MRAKAIWHTSLLLLVICLASATSTNVPALGDDATTHLGESRLDQSPVAAPGSLGIWLVGIVVADDPGTSLAIIEDAESREQRVYREGDRVDGVLIKRIFRNEIIVDAGEGARRLPLQQGFGIIGPRVSRDVASQQPVQQEPTEVQAISGRSTTIRLDRNEVRSALRDLDRILRQVDVSPITRFDEPAGFRIMDIPPGSILSRLGLRDGDIIKRVDDEEITHPEQAEAFLRRIREGGDLVVTVNKRRRTRHIVLEIH